MRERSLKTSSSLYFVFKRSRSVEKRRYLADKNIGKITVYDLGSFNVKFILGFEQDITADCTYLPRKNESISCISPIKPG